MSAATRHFLREGFERTSLDRIAAAARVSKQAIYAEFRDKDDLFDQVVRAGISDRALLVVPADREPQAALEAFAGHWFERFATPTNFGLLRANIVAMRRLPELAAAVHDFRRNASRGLADYLAVQAARGAIDTAGGSSLELATRLGGIAVEGTRYFLGHDLPSRRQRVAQARLAVDLFLHGLGAPAVRAAAGTTVRPARALPVPPQDRPRLRLPAERFDRLCEAAAAEFLERGFDGASLGNVTAATGVGRATIYRQFGSKEGLFVHVIGREIEAASRELPAPRGTVPLKRLQLLARAALDRHLEPRSIRLQRLLVQESAGFPGLARGLYDAQVARSGRAFARVVEDAGLGSPAPAVVRAFHTLATFAVRYLVTSRTIPAAERDAVSAQAATIMCRGVGLATPGSGRRLRRS